MYLVIRGDRLYEGYSIVYTTKSGKKSTKGCIGKALGSKSELLAKDPLALEKLRAELKKKSAPNQATERTRQLLEEIPKKRPSLPYAGEPVLCYANTSSSQSGMKHSNSKHWSVISSPRPILNLMQRLCSGRRLSTESSPRVRI